MVRADGVMPRAAHCDAGSFRRVVLLAVCFAVAWTDAASAQLRPYEPSQWELFDGGPPISLAVGASRFAGQRASLAGEEGSLWEVADLTASLRTGRVVISAGGSAHRAFRRDSTFAPGYGGAESDADGRRTDVGDFLLSTTVRLTPEAWPELAVLRFGTRLPTTDNRVGLERDQTDFFATIGGRLDRGPLHAFAETGVGIHGTREPQFEQSDVLVYIIGLGLRETPLAPTLLLVGHADGLKGRNIRGNEELAEARLRVRSGGRISLQSEAIVGLTAFSPAWGVRVWVGGRM